MSSAPGSVSTQPPGVSPSNKFTAKFILPSTQSISFSGNLNIAVPALNSAKMTLTYNKLSELTQKQPFSGIIGAEKFSIQFDNGPTIVGPIVGGPEDGQSVSGTGDWLIS